jgi:hypothetical protein
MHIHTQTSCMHPFTQTYTHPSPGKQDTKHLSTRMLVKQVQGGTSWSLQKKMGGKMGGDKKPHAVTRYTRWNSPIKKCRRACSKRLMHSTWSSCRTLRRKNEKKTPKKREKEGKNNGACYNCQYAERCVFCVCLCVCVNLCVCARMFGCLYLNTY